MSKFILALLSLFVLAMPINAQVTDRKFEVGGFFTSITLDDFKERVSPGFASGDATVNGIGGRLTYNINENFAIDGEGTFFPSAHLGNEESGQKMQGFVGVKAGARNKWVGAFAKARPGIMWFGEFTSRGGCTPTSFGSVCGVDHEKDFALDLGGVVEFYPAERAIIRVDVGNTLVRFQDRTLGTIGNPVILDGGFKSNFQVSLGFGWRF
jgi:hypothetical protein